MWNMSDLYIVFKNLKINISRDNDGYINKNFRPGCVGEDLKRSILLMMNKLKKEQIAPFLFLIANITTIPKHGSKILLKNERGIFRVSVLRNIFMRLIYNQEYPTIDQNMSDSNIGGRKNRGCRNHIFIVNGIIHDVMNTVKNNPVVIQIYDFSQMFDAIKLEEAICDMFDVGVQNDNLNLLYKSNKDIYMAVKTPYGLSERKIITSSVLQGDTWGPSFVSVQVDQICKDAEEMGHIYKY